MAKQPVAEAHPALVQVEPDEAATNYDFGIEGIEGWDTFTQGQRDFLMAMPFHRTITATCRALGRKDSYCNNARLNNKNFSSAVDHIQKNKGGLLKQQRQDLMFQALQVLRRATTLDEGGSYEKVPSSALRAAEFLFKINGFATVDTQPKDPSPTFINVHGGGRLNLAQRATEIE
jgi:hypothetical protein